MNIKIENWMGREIRFVEKNPGDWWAIAKDVALALGYKTASDLTRRLDVEEKSNMRLTRIGKGGRPDTIISEFGIYEAIFGSENKEAKEFKKWVKQVIKELRQSSGLEGFQVFRMLDKEHQKEMMSKLSQSLQEPKRVNFIKANTIANKAVSSRHGHPKALKKNQMTPRMLVEREPILADTVDLMIVKDKFQLELSVSEEVYGKYVQ
ncbi:BRO family protein [Sporosarcina sp. FSL K6-2383]|uniref:BRO-N domain-containing protein n=1 Tax=Sporosarcina sp. FSL K6-2383 TaxID=2921556 RepID=UPI00315A2573